MKKKIVTAVAVILIITGLLFTAYFIKIKFFDPFKNVPEQLSQTRVTEQGDTYKSPIDLDKMRKKYPDIIAWLDIPNSNVSYPIFQNKNDTKYLRHDRDGKYSIGGELFTEFKYNKSDFSDPVTVIYGHNMHNTTIFGPLQKMYADKKTASKYKEIVIYLGNCEYHYNVFCATTFDDRHILYSYDFSKKRVYNSFIQCLRRTRSIDTFFDNDEFSKGNGKIIVLSTCKDGNTGKRFLVLATMQNK